MMHFDRVPEPPDFDEKARQPGLKWLREHADANRPHDYWRPFTPALRKGFRGLCAYAVLHTPVGTVDHYISFKGDRSLAYEWSNYRYASDLMNRKKSNRDDRVLDPHEVSDDWFEILLPSLQLVATDRLPPEQEERARHVLEEFGLRDDERIVRWRRSYYEQYLSGKLTFEGLRDFAPLIARAVEKQQAADNGQRTTDTLEPP